jgi:tetratricopeptide (TPR) repeat protein
MSYGLVYTPTPATSVSSSLVDVYGTILLSVLAINLITSTSRSSLAFIAGTTATYFLHAPSAFEVEVDGGCEDESPFKAGYLWMYLGALSQDTELMGVFFPSGDVREQDVWAVAESLRGEDKSFQEFTKALLMKGKLQDSIDNDNMSLPGDLVNFLMSLKKLNMHTIMNAEECNQFISSIQKNEETLDEDYDEEYDGPLRPSTLVWDKLHDLNLPVDLSSIWEKPGNSNKSCTDFREQRELADCYQIIGKEEKAIQLYLEVIEKAQGSVALKELYAAYESAPPAKRQKVTGYGFHNSTVGSDELSVADCVKMAYFGLGEAYAKCGNNEASFGAFQNALC